MFQDPIPRDIPLPLPANHWLLEGLLVVAFLAHILFVNLVVGGSILVLGLEIRGVRDPDFDRLAQKLAATVTVNKSLAVVLGVAPLLLINVLYTVHFYTANALTDTAWILLVPSVSAAFLLLYLHKYTWQRLAAHKGVHIAILSLAVVLFLLIPFVFLANVNLMTFPERWTGVRGFVSALALPNVLPRYVHFLGASLVLTSLFAVHYFGRPAFRMAGEFDRLTKPAVRRVFYSVAFVVSIAQFLAGPLVLFTLPSKGLHETVLGTILLGAVLAVPAVWMIWKDMTVPEPHGKRLPFIVAYLTMTVLCMALGRHMYRALALAEHRGKVEVATKQWVRDAAQAAYDQRTRAERGAAGISEGQHGFQTTCAACHARDRVLVGPSLTEIARLYAGNPDGIVAWARAPGWKRKDGPQMPAFASMEPAMLLQIASHMLATGAETH
jgi:cytochrome c